MASTSPTGAGPAASPALENVRRQFALLEQSVGWLLGALQIEVGNSSSDMMPTAERLSRLARRLGEEGLIDFADSFGELAARRDRIEAGEEPGDAAFRFEQAAARALLLYGESQGRKAAGIDLIVSQLPDEADEEGRQRHLAQIGASVREALDANPRAEKIPTRGLELYAIPDFVSEEERQGLMALIDRDCYPSGVLGEHPDREFRTSKSCNLSLGDPLVDLIDSRIADALGIDRRFSETMQGQRYEVGQQFKPHHDFFHKGEGYYDSAQRQGGQRSWTAMLFLNEPEAGGCTNFPDAGVKVTPEAGKMLLWNNMKPDGSPNYFSLHQGMPVEAGIKYVITKWFRERPWG